MSGQSTCWEQPPLARDGMFCLTSPSASHFHRDDDNQVSRRISTRYILRMWCFWHIWGERVAGFHCPTTSVSSGSQQAMARHTTARSSRYFLLFTYTSYIPPIFSVYSYGFSLILELSLHPLLPFFSFFLQLSSEEVR